MTANGRSISGYKNHSTAKAKIRSAESAAEPPETASIVTEQISDATASHVPDELGVKSNGTGRAKKVRGPKKKSEVDGKGQPTTSILEKDELSDYRKTVISAHQKECNKTVVGDVNVRTHSASDNAPAGSSQPLSSPVGGNIIPPTYKSWAAVCSASPTLSKLPTPPAPQVTAATEYSVTSARGSSTCADTPKSPSSPSDPPSIAELNEFIHCSGSWSNIATSKPSYEVPDAEISSPMQEQQTVPTAADFAVALPCCPQQASRCSAASYVEVAQSPSSEPTAPDCVSTDAPPQPKVLSEVTVASSVSGVVEQPLDNLYVMIRPQRQNLFTGPRITINIGTVKVTGIFKRVAMAVSSVLNEHFVKSPDSVEYTSPDDILVPGAVRYLLIAYPQNISQEFMAYAVPMQGTFAKNVSLLHASRKLGMEQYTRPLLNAHVSYLREELPSYEEIAIVERMATSEKDPLWTYMVNHLCHDRFKKLIPDSEDFEAFLTDHPRLMKAMEKADDYFAGVAKKKWEEGQVTRQAAEDERRMRWKQDQAEKREQIARKQEAVQSIRQKMDAKGASGLMIATAEEAALLRNR